VTGLGEAEVPLTEKEQELAALRRQLQDERKTLDRLIEVTTQLNSTLDLHDLLELIMKAAAELLHAETSSLMLVDEETNELIFEVATGDPGQEAIMYRIPPGQGVAGWVAQNAQAVVVDNPAADARFYNRLDKATGFETKNILAVPMVARNRVIGVVEVINKIGAPGFNQHDLALAQALTSQAAVSIDNNRMHAQLADAVVMSRLSYRL
jgi:sigma-B regulation protein RsbU (phosphoserine phosphatase)